MSRNPYALDKYWWIRMNLLEHYSEDAIRRYCIGSEDRGRDEGISLGDGNYITPKRGVYV